MFTLEDLQRHKRWIETLAARAELLVQICGSNLRLRGELDKTLNQAYLELDKLENEVAGWLYVQSLTARLDAVTI